MKCPDVQALGKKILYNLKKCTWEIFLFQFAISFFTFSVASWHIATLLKIHFLGEVNFNLNTWVDIFFNPLTNNLINYVFLCAILLVLSLVIYFALNINLINKIKGLLEKNNIIILQIIALLVSSIILLRKSIFITPNRLAILLIITSIPVLIVFPPRRICFNGTKIRFWLNTIAVIATTVLVIVISMESVNVLRGPIYLMNEYDIPSETKIGLNTINNNSFLASIPDDISNNFDNSYLTTNRNQDVLNTSLIQQVFLRNNLPTTKPLSVDKEPIDIDRSTISDFFFKNEFQFAHFEMSRGQVNHIGTILNPVGALELGKSLSTSYLQYGIGNTLLFKWIMDLFGGVSLQNFYKCYLIYIVYTISFLLMLCYVFRDPVYVMAGISGFAFAYFYQEYIPFIFAPGLIPSIHLLDATAVIAFFAYVKSERLKYLLAAQILVILAVYINMQFGFSLLISLQAAVILYHMEFRPKGRWKWCLSFLALFTSLLMFRFMSTGTQGETLKYFSLGLFSWPAKLHHILYSIIFIVASYLFLFMLKHTRHQLKYVFVMVFAYTQCLLLYFFWSGLSNHLPTAMPFLGVEILLVLFILQNRLINIHTRISQNIVFAVAILTIPIIANTFKYTKDFYSQKLVFMNNFATHTVYNWDFDRAKVVTTINETPIKQSIDLINKYTPDSNGIYIISRYDNILPFLAKHYSLMPFYEMTWRLFSNKETAEAIDLIKEKKPVYLFIDTDILEESKDQWETFSRKLMSGESASRKGRYTELRKIYTGISTLYERLEQGPLISVYKRNTN